MVIENEREITIWSSRKREGDKHDMVIEKEIEKEKRKRRSGERDKEREQERKPDMVIEERKIRREKGTEKRE